MEKSSKQTRKRTKISSCRNSFLLGVVALAVAGTLSAHDVAVRPDGSVSLTPDVVLRPLVAAPGWRGDGRQWATPKTMVEERPDGRLSVRLSFSVKRDAPDGLGALGLVVEAPRMAVDGRTWRTDIARGVFREGNRIRRLGAGKTRNALMPVANGNGVSFASETPLGFYVQDGAAVGGKQVSFRVGDVDVPRAVTNGEVVTYAVTVAVVEPLETPWTRPHVIACGKDWIPLDCRPDVLPGSALDFSRFGALDAPAGRHGWLRAEGERFAFAGRPGVPVRFYGVNLCFEANFPKDADAAERLVAHLRRRGYNAIRLHHHDRLLTETSVDGVSLDPTRVDQLDLLVAAAIRHGVYVTTDLFVSRRVRYRQIGIDRPGVVNQQVFKSLTDLHEPAFRNWADFARNFLGHVNPYTGRAYRDEPALPLVSIVNEGGLFMGWSYTGKTSEPIIVEAWRKWVEEKRRANPSFHPEVSPDVVPLTPYDRKYSAAFALFQAEVEATGLAKKKAYLRSIGVKAMLTSDNSGPHWVALQATTGPLDYVDDHFYQDHPQFLGARWTLPTKAPCKNPVLDAALQCCTSPYTRMAGKPFTVTEYAFCAPNPYRAQGGLLVGALAALQDWSGIWHFSRDRVESEPCDAGRIGFFSVDADPIKQATDRAVMALFLRGDMEPFPADKGVSLLITPESVDPTNTTAAFRSAPGWMADACWKRRTSSCLDRLAAGTQAVIPRERAEEPEMRRLATDVPVDPRIVLDRTAGGFAVSTPRTAGGFVEIGRSFDAGALHVAVSGSAATVWATSLDERPLDESQRILLTHLTDAQNEGAMFKDASFSELLDWGAAPLVRTGSAEILLRHAHPAACRVWALRQDGSRLCEVPTAVRDGRLALHVAISEPDPSLHYEITCPYQERERMK